jgi:hypothetical protein
MIRISAGLVLLSIAAVLTIAACSVILGQGDPCFRAVDKLPTDTLVELEGHFVASFEVSSFVPCGCASDPGYGWGYWLESDPQSGFSEAYMLSSPTSDLTDPGRVVYVRFEGMISDYAPHGHLGMYLRQVTVANLLEADSDGQCRLGD